MTTALVLSGGGSRGAFQIGVVQTLWDKGFRPDIITGVSVGAFNSLFIAQHKLDELQDLWAKIKSADDIYVKRWLAAPLMFLGWQWGYPSLYKPGRFAKILKRRIRAIKVADFKAELRVGAVDLVSGNYVSVNHTHPLLGKFIAASMAVPLAFPPVKIRGNDLSGLYIDGCVRNLTPLSEAVRAGADDIHIVLANTTEMATRQRSFKTYDEIVSRTVDVALHEIFMHNIDNVLMRNESAALQKSVAFHFPDKEKEIIKYRHINLSVYEPPSSAKIPALLDFNPKSIRESYDLGVIAAQIPKNNKQLASKNESHKYV